VVVLRDFQGVSPAEACEVLEITDLAQRVHLSRARATLRRALEEEDRRCA
jgi:DNA-directed RNA polymerase specialized sigma24 family protein